MYLKFKHFQNDMRFPGQQGQIFGPQHPNNHPGNHGLPGIHPQAHPTAPVMHARAKWHIPQSAQQNNGIKHIQYEHCKRQTYDILSQFQKWLVHQTQTL